MLSKLFGFDPSKHNIKTEVMAGITTFLTMAYILAVNPSIYSNLADKGMDTNAVFTATALAAIIGTLVGVCTKAGMMQKDGRIPGLSKAFMADAVATMAGACLGASTTTTYVESAAGVAQGGRSGLTAFSTAVCFAVAMFFAPLFLSIPAAATTPVLVIVGLFMLTPVKDIDLDDYAESIPAFITIVMMPLTYSISDGILCGVISYVLINMLCMNWKKLNPTLYVLAALFIMKYIFI